MRAFRLALPATVLFLGHSSYAQLPFLDITSSQSATELQVSIRSDGPFDGLFSSVVFTVRCDQASGVVIGEPLQGLPQAQYCSVFKSDVQQDQGAYTYQIFVGFGNSALSNFSTSWVAGEEVLFCTIPLSDPNGACRLVNDAWTDTHNGTYYVSLNGEDRTGEIYGTNTAVEQVEVEQSTFSLFPNPAKDHVQLILRSAVSASKVRVVLRDPAGRQVRKERVLMSGGSLSLDMDLVGLAAGLYTVQVDLEGRQLFQSVVIE